MAAALLLCAFALLCLVAATVPQVRVHHRHTLGQLGRHAGATDDWADVLAAWTRSGLGSAVAR